MSATENRMPDWLIRRVASRAGVRHSTVRAYSERSRLIGMWALRRILFALTEIEQESFRGQ